MAQASPITPETRRSPLWSRACDKYHVSVPLRKTLARRGCWQSGSEPLACGRASGGQSSSHAGQDRRQFHARALERRASRGALASHWAATARSRSDEGDESKKYAVRLYGGLPYRACETLYRGLHQCRVTLYTLLSTALYSVEGRGFTPQRRQQQTCG